jgi:hypothetical protein
MRIPWAFEFFPVEPPATRVHCTTAKLVVGSRPPPRAATEVPNESDTGERTPAAEAAAQGQKRLSLSDLKRAATARKVKR